ncbi:uncharacterized protein F5891DRAFT_1000966 [Suillus fuscotomentosus]|uniref:Uncharacterized protein n=1 Tax=Suillus fuscotomentosus TaxID=1912939 RepID=A0AAD4ELN3_9AGAM|nr:uncharacterized protein F5891DRAFT_1000966 [Suillus fuscotomentosus]KAG1907294.1 hypothetical protein F5891DRAFT_1000966 [Suillus fuscotomentosus]
MLQQLSMALTFMLLMIYGWMIASQLQSMHTSDSVIDDSSGIARCDPVAEGSVKVIKSRGKCPYRVALSLSPRLPG